MARRSRSGSEVLLQVAAVLTSCVTPGPSFGMAFVQPALCRVTYATRARTAGATHVVRLTTQRGRATQAAVLMSTEAGQRPSIPVAGGLPDKALDKEGGSKPPVKKRVLSGVQPTGNLHLGNYLGAIKQWVDNQDTYENFFFVVDLHAITVPQDPKKLNAGVYNAAATYLAAGIDPEKSRVFVQSHVSAHAELAWLLSCSTPLNWLERMIQFKEKKVKQGENVGAGLMTYPVLMAADILLYRPDLVPAGEDQRQHVELTRDLARRFNDQFCKRKRKTFKEPQALVVKEGGRVMSLADGRSKMSKSDPVEGSRINLTDPPDVIGKKLRKCKTDMHTGLEWDNPERPECTNLLTIYQAVTGKTREDIALEVQDMSWGTFKPMLADATVEYLSVIVILALLTLLALSRLALAINTGGGQKPFQTRYNEILDDRSYLNKVLRDGAEAADEVASETLGWAKEAMGIPLRRDLD